MSSEDGSKTALFTRISGGQRPYKYSIKFNNKAVSDINDVSEDGQIAVDIDTSHIARGVKVPFTLTVRDENLKEIVHESTASEQLTGSGVPPAQSPSPA